MCRGHYQPTRQLSKLMVVAVRRKLFPFVSTTDGVHTVNKLLMRTLPKDFPEDSVYTWFPMTTPSTMEKVLPAGDWNFTRPDQRPPMRPSPA